jgi:cell division inhibitor SepF
MGILDSLKSRLNIGSNANQQGYYDDGNYYEGDYDDGRGGEEAVPYDNYRELTSYQSGQDTYRSGTNNRLVTQRPFGVNRIGYQNDNHAPLISASDVRSQQGLSPRYTQQAEGAYSPRQSSRFDAAQSPENDAFAYRDAQSRTASLAPQESYNEQQRLESTTRIDVQTSSLPQYNLRSGLVNVRQGSRLSRQVNVFKPVSYADAEKVAQSLKQGDAVVVVLTATRPELAKRILDFVFGAASVLDGKVDRIADRVFVITQGVALTPEERDLLVSRGIV